jgi:hypothetical protein
MNRKRPATPLRLERQTLRTLSDAELADVDGGRPGSQGGACGSKGGPPCTTTHVMLAG